MKQKTLILGTTLALALGSVSQVQSGFILRQFYDGVFDAAGARTTDYNNLLANRPGAPLFPSGSTFSETLTASAVTVENAGDDYGSLMRGYIIAPMDGDYTLAINSDDSSALWVSADHSVPGDFPSTNPGGQRAPDAEETGCCASLFGGARLEERTTAPITLSRGEIRYVEMISQEGGGGAFMELGWTLPDGTQEPIPGAALIPYTASGSALELAFGQSVVDGTDFGGFAPGTSGPDSATVDEARSVTFTVNVFGGQQPYTFQWMENGSPIDGAILGHYTIENAALSQDSHTFSVEIKDANGASVTSPDAFLTVLPDTVNPAVLGAVGSGSPQGIIVSFSEAVDPASATETANYSISGQSVDILGASMLSATQVLLDVSEYNTDNMTLSVSNVTDLSAAANAVAANTQVSIGLKSDLAGFWNFDEADGEAVVDASGSGNNGTLMGADGLPFRSTDVPDLGGRTNISSIQFDGTDDYVFTPYPGVGGPNPRTVAFWFKSDSTTTHTIIGWGDSTSNGTKYHIRVEPSTGSIRTEAQGGNNWATTPINDLQWHHIVSVVPDMDNPMNLDVLHYVDGQLDPRLGGGNVAINTDITGPNAALFSIGRGVQGSSPRYVNATMDDVVVFEKELTAEEIAALAGGQSPLELASKLAGAITITEQPVSQTTPELQDITFSVSAEGSNAIQYQWYENGEPVAGATGSSLTLLAVDISQNGNKYQVDVYNADGTFQHVMSNEVTLTVINDFDAPEVTSIRGISGGINQIEIIFNEIVTQASAEDIANYTLEGGTINGATLQADQMTVLLDTSVLNSGESYNLNIDGVRDIAGDGNVLTGDFGFVANVTYYDQVIFDNPARYFRLGETEGTVAVSETGILDTANLDGAYQNNVTLNVLGLVPSQLENRAAAFNSSLSHRIIVPNGSDLNATAGPWEDKTVEMWFNASAMPAPGTTGLAASKGLWEQGGGSRALALYLWRDPANDNPDEGLLVWNPFNNPTDAGGVGSPWGTAPNDGTLSTYVQYPVVVGETYHVVAVMDGDPNFAGELILYVNGQEVDRLGGIGLIYNHTGDVQIGRGNALVHTGENGNYGFFDGVLDEVSVYNSVLSAERVTAHYETGMGAGAPEARLVNITPAPGSINVLSEDGIEITLEDGSATAVNPDNISLTLNGVAVTPEISKDGTTTTVRFTPDQYASQSVQTVKLNWDGQPAEFEWTFTSMTIIPAAWAAPVGSGVDSGFNIRTFQAVETPTLANNTQRGEDMIAGVIASEFTATGTAQVINFNQDDQGNNGAFRLDTGFPDAGLAEAGLIGAHTDNITGEFTAYLELPAGRVDMGVNSDDGFRVTVGRVVDVAEQTLELGVYSGGGGATTAEPQYPFSFLVEEAGVYAFRMIWYEGNGGASVEWSVKDANGDLHLLNSDTSPIKAYLSRTEDPPPPSDDVILSVSSNGGDVTITWEPGVGTLQSAPAVDGPWTNVDGASGGSHTVTPDGNAFFRVQQ